MTITRKDNGAEKLLRRLLSKGALSVGILAGEAAAPHKAKTAEARISDLFKEPSEQLTIGEIAAVHEFGLGSSPERSFLRGWVDESTAQIEQVIVAGARALARGKLTSPLQFLNQTGAWAVGQIQARMARNIPPPLAPETIRRKGSTIALIDTGQLRSSISFRVDAVETAKGARVQK